MERIGDIVKSEISRRPKKWVFSKNLVESVSRRAEKKVHHLTISKHLRDLASHMFVIREKDPEAARKYNTRYRYMSNMTPDCCDRSHITQDIKQDRCLQCGRIWS